MTHVDAYNRPISYLRISVTDRCNLRCTYCMPPEGVPWQPHEQILRFEEIELVALAAARLGISKIRLTGGEPLVRPGVVDLVRMIAAVPGVDDLALTTNGTLLADYATRLAEAGLKRVNVSLDTLRPERYRRITRRGDLDDVLQGLDAAHAAGLSPVKINTVVVRGLNDDEVVDIARKTVESGWNVRFIEMMPVGSCNIGDGDWRNQVVTAHEIRKAIEASLGSLLPARIHPANGPARYYRLPESRGTIGFITPISEHFCCRCNRLRLTSDGQLRPCLLSDQEIDLRKPLRQGAGIPEIMDILKQGIKAKPMAHNLDQGSGTAKRTMSEIGG